MSEGSFWPKSWQEAIPLLVWCVLIFAFGFEGVASLIHGEWWQASFGFAGMAGLTAMLIHWSHLRQISDVRWLIAASMVALVVVTFSPFMEQRRWPYDAQWLVPFLIAAITVVTVLMFNRYQRKSESVAISVIPDTTQFSNLSDTDFKAFVVPIIKRARTIAQREEDEIQSHNLTPKAKGLSEDERRAQINTNYQKRREAEARASAEIGLDSIAIQAIHYELLRRLNLQWPTESALHSGALFGLTHGSCPTPKAWLILCSYLETLVDKLP